MKKNALKDLWKYSRNYTDLDASSNLVMVAFIPCFVVMALYLKLCWDVQSHKMNSSTSTVIALPLKSLTESLSDEHPDCSDSGISDARVDGPEVYQPILVEEYEIRYH
jgi:hypothetical protein